MATLTHSVIEALEQDPELCEQALGEVVNLMRLEQELAERLESALHHAGFDGRSGWIDWLEVIGYFRERASAEYVRDELRRNRRIGLKVPAEAR
jgi:hypothetical protein